MSMQDIIQDLTTDEIISILEHYGATIKTQNEKEVIFSAICHSNPNSYKLYYSIEYKTFKCWSRCGNIGDLVDLLAHLNNYTKGDAIKEIKDFFHLSSEPKLRKGFRVRKVYERPKLKDVEIELLPIPEYKPYIYTMFKTISIPEWECEGITFETIKKFNIRYNYQNDTIVIPHFCHSDENRIIGIRVRNTSEYAIDNYGKYCPMYYEGHMYSHSLGKALYGLSNNRHNIKEYKKCIIGEGEKFVLQLDSMYPDTNISVALCGSYMSLTQKKLLLDLGVEECLFALDKQYETEEERVDWKNKIVKMAQELIENDVECYMLLDELEGLINYRDAPTDKGMEIFKQLVNKKIKIERISNDKL
jgi:hypothetical protein